ncbi:sensor histidine kinase [Paenibacillus sp. EKM102P]|uniref:sensor histidine kinase n=1 Tax=Paenibacillus TaxID=44249 RepID=UPI000D328223|nr:MULTISPECIES: sensor histidine kinase [Paenibacillus]KAF6614744.1 sensor histidine kinase [Paenibacillus sp. EKM101P]KAF6617506.1 sensor histidine kinase [Paenibacillus sp. EKM102P]KAF6625717.1 sensor histidine kinase [Paenibacillus sp. EKM10P]KAF6641956.1 sensor histidine kinase [Paenibacillus sp. EKM11P]PTU44491.1 two-component sensor histidine kinase [Paenibacillus polymyxa]
MMRRFQSIQYRLFVLFLLSMSSIVLAVSLLFYNRTTVQFHDKISELARKNVSQTAGLFELLLDSYNSLSKSISNNMDLVRLLTTDHSDLPAVNYINERTITNILGAIYYSREDLIGIHVITDTGKVYNYGNYMNVIDTHYEHTEWYREIRRSAGKIAWLGVYPHSVIDQVETRPVFAFGRQLYDLDEHKPIGIVLFEAEPRSILSALHNLRLSTNSQVYLLGHENRIVSATSSDPPPDLRNLEPQVPEEDVIVDRNNERVVIASKLPFADWSVISVTPSEDLNVELAQTQRYLFIVAPILIMVSALIASIVSRGISLPLKRVIREMKRVETGNFRHTVNIESYEEINQLATSFNHMVRQIAELIELVRISSVSEKNAELHALQTQVNPHFLYNTLDMIYWMLDEKGQDQLGEVVLSLSHMFRYSSHWEEGADVSLREEVEQVGHYLTIIQARLEGRVSVDVNIEEQWLDIRLPKMTLQPLIENAVKHGLEPLHADTGGKLLVRAEEYGGVLSLHIIDNGVGMEYERWEVVQVALAEPGKQAGSGQAGGIGLQNLNLRLRHMFGEEYGLRISSTPGAGTTVTVSVPLPQKEEKHEYSDS